MGHRTGGNTDRGKTQAVSVHPCPPQIAQGPACNRKPWKGNF
jgi:hypothetical protein